MIPYGKQNISKKDIDAVVDVLNSDFLTQGPVVPEFERTVVNYCGVKYGVATNSATSALHIACLALDIGKGSLVWTSSISFVASSNCALYCGADVDFVDVDLDTINISPEMLHQKIQFNLKRNLPLPNVVIVVHMAGQSCDMEGISELSKKYGFKVIEDASHAIGGKYHDRAVGSCQYSNITIFSFHPVKIITTAEGGMAVTNSKELCEKMRRLRSHGVTRDHELIIDPDGPWYYEQVDLGFNYRMTEMQAALGLSQMSRLEEFISSRKKIVKKYHNALIGEFKNPISSDSSAPSWHLYVIQIDENKLNRNAVFRDLKECGLGVNVHYRPIYLNSYYKKLGFQPGLCPNSEKYYSRCISLPLYHHMPESDQSMVINTVNRVCE